MKFYSSIATTLVVAIASVMLSGCGETYNGPDLVDCEGTVMVDGKPLAGASVSMSNGIRNCSAVTDDAGMFKITTAEGPRAYPGAPVGEYKVTVRKTIRETYGLTSPGPDATPAQIGEFRQKYEAAAAANRGKQPKSEVPARYGNPGTSELKITLTEEGDKEIKLELSGT